MDKCLYGLYIAILKYKHMVKDIKVDPNYNFVVCSGFLSWDITVEEYFRRLCG